MKLALPAACAVLALVAQPVFADALSDAGAAAQALNQGNFKLAERLFTDAIKSGQLSRDDLESAYVGRGMAEVQLNSPDHARRDADSALHIKPGDPDAVTLWMNTKVQVMPADTAPTDSSTLTYTCLLTNPRGPGRLIYEVDVDESWVRAPRSGEAGRKLLFHTSGSMISWNQHEETNNGYADQFMTLDRSTGVLNDTYTTSRGVSGASQWSCQPGPG